MGSDSSIDFHLL
jgi:hypothetical protein